MRQGLSPDVAAQLVFDDMLRHYPDMRGGVVAITANGTHGRSKRGAGGVAPYRPRGGGEKEEGCDDVIYSQLTV